MRRATLSGTRFSGAANFDLQVEEEEAGGRISLRAISQATGVYGRHAALRGEADLKGTCWAFR